MICLATKWFWKSKRWSNSAPQASQEKNVDNWIVSVRDKSAVIVVVVVVVELSLGRFVGVAGGNWVSSIMVVFSSILICAWVSSILNVSMELAISNCVGGSVASSWVGGNEGLSFSLLSGINESCNSASLFPPPPLIAEFLKRVVWSYKNCLRWAYSNRLRNGSGSRAHLRSRMSPDWQTRIAK